MLEFSVYVAGPTPMRELHASQRPTFRRPLRPRVDFRGSLPRVWIETRIDTMESAAQAARRREITEETKIVD